MDLFELINAMGIIGALGVGAFQTWRAAQDARERDEDQRTERALELYRDLVVEGDTAAAFHRLSLALRRRGTECFGVTTWLLLSDEDFNSGGILDPMAAGSDSPFEDLYRVLWYFERVEVALHHHLVNEDVLMRTIGFHCWWWGELLRDVRAPKATAAIQALAPRAERWARSSGDYTNWIGRCASDFGGSGPRNGSPEVTALAQPGARQRRSEWPSRSAAFLQERGRVIRRRRSRPRSN